jgi:hypothetical protein
MSLRPKCWIGADEGPDRLELEEGISVVPAMASRPARRAGREPELHSDEVGEPLLAARDWEHREPDVRLQPAKRRRRRLSRRRRGDFGDLREAN